MTSQLCVAAYEGNLDRVRALLADGVAVNAYANSGNVRGYTALTAAAGFCNSTEIIDTLLLHGADIDRINHYGRTALMSAVIDGSPVIVAHLMRRGADWQLRHKNGMTAMDYARKALMESRTEEQRAAAIEVEVALRSGRARQRLGQLARHARIEGIARHWRELLLLLHAEIHFRPYGDGARLCREHFEACACDQGAQEELAASPPA